MRLWDFGGKGLCFLLKVMSFWMLRFKYEILEKAMRFLSLLCFCFVLEWWNNDWKELIMIGLFVNFCVTCYIMSWDRTETFTPNENDTNWGNVFGDILYCYEENNFDFCLVIVLDILDISCFISQCLSYMCIGMVKKSYMCIALSLRLWIAFESYAGCLFLFLSDLSVWLGHIWNEEKVGKRILEEE